MYVIYIYIYIHTYILYYVYVYVYVYICIYRFVSRGLGWRIHESVEDTKLSTNKQHTLSCAPHPARPRGQGWGGREGWRGYSLLLDTGCV